MAKKFYAPVLVSGLEDLQSGLVEVHISSDRRSSSVGKLVCRVTQVDGTELDSVTKNVRIPVNGSCKVHTLRLRKFIEQQTARNVVVWLHLEDDTGQELSNNFVSFCRPKYMELSEPEVKIKVGRDKSGAFRVSLKARKPALWAWLELGEHDAQFEDNFVCLEPGVEVSQLVRVPSIKTVAAFKNAVTVKSILDTYNGH